MGPVHRRMSHIVFVCCLLAVEAKYIVTSSSVLGPYEDADYADQSQARVNSYEVHQRRMFFATEDGISIAEAKAGTMIGNGTKKRQKRQILNTLENHADTRGCYLLYDRTEQNFLTMTRKDMSNQTRIRICENIGPGRFHERDCFVKVLFSSDIPESSCRLQDAGPEEAISGLIQGLFCFN